MANEDALLTEIRERERAAEAVWGPIRDEGRTDMQYVSGDPWDDNAKRQRAGRPCLVLDELGQYVNQTVNEVRLNKRAIKVAPMPDAVAFTDQKNRAAIDKQAEIRANLIRQIEYQSNAPQGAYTTGFENTIQRSFGWWRVLAEYESEDSFEQRLRIGEIPNPDMVLPDADHLMADGSDLDHLFFREWYSHAEFARKFPDARDKGLGRAVQDLAPAWVKGDRVMVSEYWKKETKRRTLIGFQTPQGLVKVWKDELENGMYEQVKRSQNLRERAVDTVSVCSYLTNGVEILQDRQEWKGKAIPFIPCYGKVLFVESDGKIERKMMSMVRLARDPYMLYCYTRSAQQEVAAMTPKFPYFAFRGSLSVTALADLNRSMYEPVGVIEVETVVPGLQGTPPAFPQREAYEPPIQAYEVLAEAARRAIQAAMGTSPLPSSAQRRNDKSGKALQQIEESGQKGSFHFIDHYEASIRRTGEILNELLPFYYDTPRDVTVRKPDDSTEIVRVNDPAAVDDKGQPRAVSLKEGRFDVTISTGPAFDSQREEASAFADVLMGTPFAQVIADLAVKLKNVGPVGDEIADRLTPPEFRKPKDGEVDPMQQQQQLQQAQQAIEALSKELETRVEQIRTEEVKAKAQIELQKLKNAAAIRIAEIGAMAKGLQIEADHAHDHEAQALGLAFEAQEAESQRQHDAAMAAMGHDQSMEQGEQGHMQALEQSERQAALQPPAGGVNA